MKFADDTVFQNGMRGEVREMVCSCAALDWVTAITVIVLSSLVQPPFQPARLIMMSNKVPMYQIVYYSSFN